ncbi:MAG: 50S ribosomal protein L1 [Thermoplasmata archaeon]|nr:50S ribosomal protein L1 [Thermoplasmata archaeon]
MHGSKRFRKAAELVDKNKEYTLSEAIDTLKQVPAAKFDETVEVSLLLGVDPKKSDQMVRGSVALPHGTGKAVRVVVIAQGDEAKAAEDAGAEHVGYKDLLDKIGGGFLDFDAMVATPETMKDVGRLGKLLGPRGLMPSPKTGTVTKDVAPVVKELKAGRIDFRIDKSANIHVGIGKISFNKEQLLNNGMAFIDAVVKARPQSARGTYVRHINLSSTMGPGIRLDTKSVLDQVKSS